VWAGRRRRASEFRSPFVRFCLLKNYSTAQARLCAHDRAAHITAHGTVQYTRRTRARPRARDAHKTHAMHSVVPPPHARARTHYEIYVPLRCVRMGLGCREAHPRAHHAGICTSAFFDCISGLRVALVPALSAARPAHTHTPAAETDASSCARPRIRRLAASQPYSLRARELGRERQERRSARCWRFRIRTHPTSLRIPCLRQGA
jgi:hypothetical protein